MCYWTLEYNETVQRKLIGVHFESCHNTKIMQWNTSHLYEGVEGKINFILRLELDLFHFSFHSFLKWKTSSKAW